MELRNLFISGMTLIGLICFESVSALAISVTVSPTTLTFVSQPLYTASNSQSVTITNYLGSSINLSGLTISGDFSKVNSSTCSTSLSANSSCHIDVVFIPTATGQRTGSLSVTGISASVSLSGDGIIDASAPTAVLSAPATITNSQNFTLDGSKSFDVGGGTIATYRWTSLDASTANMSVNVPVLTSSPTFAVTVSPDNPLALGSHTFKLEVIDTSGNVSAPATVKVTVLDTSTPTAVLSAPASITNSQEFTLDGSRSFDVGGGTIASYRWTSLDASIANMTLNTPVTTTYPTFGVVISPDRPLPLGSNRFRLEVVDTSGNVSPPAIVSVTVVDQSAPTAVLAAPALVPYGQGFILDARQSFDLGGGFIATYRWTSLDASTANMAVNVPVDTTTPTFSVTIAQANPLPVGSHKFQLQVVDTSGNVSLPATVNVTVVESTTHNLSVVFSGAGGTTITSSPAGIICQAGLPNASCNYDFNHGTTVVLTATADGVSELTGWSNADTATGNPVNVTMDSDKTVTATFAPVQAPVLIYGAHGYPSVAQALAAVTGNCTIMIQGSYNDSTVQSLNFNNGFKVELAGGRNGTWGPGAGVSKLKGAMTVSSGEVVVQGIALTP